MIKTGGTHLPEELLLRYADGELSEQEALEVRNHVTTCADCAGAVAEYREAVDEYMTWHRERKGSLAPPPRPWSPPFEQPRVVTLTQPARGRSVFRWGAVAAAAAFAFITWQLSTRQTVSAAELLERASVREQAAAPVRRQIQIRTPRHTLRRPAVAARTMTAAEADLRSRFESAGFSWEDPLSARSFASWRGRLNSRTDDVRVLESSAIGSGRHYQIRTSTSEGDLAEATITLRAADMLAVRETLQFRNADWVEITEAPADAPPSAPEPQLAFEGPRADAPAAASTPAPKATAADEVRVFAALHRLGADLGEPVGVRRDESSGKVIVSMLGLGGPREQEIRAAIAGLPNVLIQTEQPEAMRAPSGAARRGAAAQPNRELEAHVGSGPVLQNFVNDVLDHSDSALARAFALRNLAARFPADIVAQLGPEDRNTLESVVRDHLQALGRHTSRLRSLLKPFVGEARAGAVPGSWQEEAPALVTSAQSLDAILSEYVAGSGGSASGAAAALADLERRVPAQP